MKRRLHACFFFILIATPQCPPTGPPLTWPPHPFDRFGNILLSRMLKRPHGNCVKGHRGKNAAFSYRFEKQIKKLENIQKLIFTVGSTNQISRKSIQPLPPSPSDRGHVSGRVPKSQNSNFSWCSIFQTPLPGPRSNTFLKVFKVTRHKKKN